MDELLDYLNSLPVQEQKAYAAKCETSVGYLRKAVSVGQRLEAALCRRLDVHSGGKVRRERLRPDVWPELLEAA